MNQEKAAKPAAAQNAEGRPRAPAAQSAPRSRRPRQKAASVKKMLDRSLVSRQPDRQCEMLRQEAGRRAEIGRRQHEQIAAVPLIKPKQEERRREHQRDRRVQQRYEETGFQKAAAPLRFGRQPSARRKHRVKLGSTISMPALESEPAAAPAFSATAKEISMAETVMLTDHRRSATGRPPHGLSGDRRYLACRRNAADAAAGLRPAAYQDQDRAERPANAGGYELVEWDEWFKLFDERELALVVPKDVPGRRDSFHEIVAPHPAESFPKNTPGIAQPGARVELSPTCSISSRGCRRNGRRSLLPPPSPATPDACGP